MSKEIKEWLADYFMMLAMSAFGGRINDRGPLIGLILFVTMIVLSLPIVLISIIWFGFVEAVYRRIK